jgi:site-specific recombinase XerD
MFIECLNRVTTVEQMSVNNMASKHRYLVKHHQTYVFKKRLNSRLQELPIFEGKAFYTKSLKTDSLSKALILRDKELARLEALEQGSINDLRELYYDKLVEKYGLPLVGTSQAKDAVYSLGVEEVPNIINEYIDGHEHTSQGFQVLYDEEGVEADPEFQAVQDYIAMAKGDSVASRYSLRDAFKKTIQVKKDQISDKELQRYEKVLDSFLAFLKMDDINLSSLQKKYSMHYVEELRSTLTDKTILGYFSKLSVIFNTAESYGMVEGVNPFKSLNLSSKVTNKRKNYYPEEIRAIYNELPDDSKLVWQVSYFTGLRPKELFSLKASSIIEVQAKDKLIKCFDIMPDGKGKTENATRLIPIHTSLLPKLESFNGFKISQSTFEKRRRKAVLSCYDESFANQHDTYSLRHTFVTTLADELEDVNLVKWLVGHSHQDVTFKNYFHGYGLQKLSSAVEKLDDVFNSDPPVT